LSSLNHFTVPLAIVLQFPPTYWAPDVVPAGPADRTMAAQAHR